MDFEIAENTFEAADALALHVDDINFVSSPEELKDAILNILAAAQVFAAAAKDDYDISL